MNNGLFSIGCSVHTIEEFTELLKRHKINSVVDVRSTPFSKHAPQFNGPQLSKALKTIGVYYLPFGNEFGARRQESDVYENGRVKFKNVMELPIFKAGVNRIKEGLIRGMTISIMCTEKDPIDCHRFHLVTRGLEQQIGTKVLHVMYGGDIETTEQIEKRMRDSLKLSPSFEIINIVMDEIETQYPTVKDQETIDRITKEKVSKLLNETAYNIYEQKVAYNLLEQGEDNE